MSALGRSTLFLVFILFSLSSCSQDSDDEGKSPYEYSDWLSNSKVKIKKYASGIKGHQSAAVYGDYAFFVTDKRNHIYVYDLKGKKYLSDITLPAGSGKDFLGYTLYHSNQSTFGTERYDSSDEFPLLYISQRARKDRRCFVEAYRIQADWDDATSQYTSFSAELVQTIYFPAMTTENALGNVNMAIDPESGEMYTYSRNNNSGEENSGVCKISRFDLPDSHEPEVYLEDSDIKDSFYIDSSAINMQGGCIKDGILYIGRGFSSVGYIYLYAIDLNLRAEVARIDLLARLIHWEPEGCFFYNGCVMLSTVGSIWKFVK